MTQDDIDNGRLICVIGIAPVKPAEFVIFRIQQKTLRNANPSPAIKPLVREEMPCQLFRDDPIRRLQLRGPDHRHQRRRHRRQAGRSPRLGLEVEIEPIEYRNGSEDITVRKIPASRSSPTSRSSAGILGDLALLELDLEGMNGLGASAPKARSSCSTRTSSEVMRWNFKRGWPCKWTGPGLNAKNNEIAMETLEICHEGLDIDGQSDDQRLNNSRVCTSVKCRPWWKPRRCARTLPGLWGVRGAVPWGSRCASSNGRVTCVRSVVCSRVPSTTYAIRGYFENGGEVAYVVRICGPNSSTAKAQWTVGSIENGKWTADAPSAFTYASYRVEARSPGEWANGTHVVIRYRLRGSAGMPVVDVTVRDPYEPIESFVGLAPFELDRQIEVRSSLIRLIPDGTPASCCSLKPGWRTDMSGN